MAKKDSKSCFLVCPIGPDGSATRIRANKFQKYVVERVLKPRGYETERADQLGEPGLITNQIIKRIVECDLLVADLTDQNANVFYELAIRHGLKKPFVHFIDKDQPIPFDNLNVRAIPVDLTDLDSVEDACTQFSKQIDAIEDPKHRPESPISVAFDLEALRSSDKPDDAILAQVLDQLASLRRDLRATQVGRSSSSSGGNVRSSGFSGITIDSPGELMTFLSATGNSELAHYIMQNITIQSVSYPDVVLSPDTGKDPRDISSELEAILRRYNGPGWKVDFLPF